MTALAIAVFLLGSTGIYLALEKGRLETILGLSLLAHAANLVVLAGTAHPKTVPALHDSAAAVETMADPLPQAMVLTAIVISMALTLYLLALLVADRGEPADQRKPGDSAKLAPANLEETVIDNPRWRTSP